MSGGVEHLDRLIELGLAGELGLEARPGLETRVLAAMRQRMNDIALGQMAATGVAIRESAGHSGDVHAGTRRRFGWRARWGAIAAAACVVIGLGLIWFGQSTTPQPPLDVRVTAQAGLYIPPDAELVRLDNRLELRSGWVLADPAAPDIVSGGKAVRAIEGRAVVYRGAIPAPDERAAIAKTINDTNNLFKLSEQEQDMLTQTNSWKTFGALAICVMAGAVTIDGTEVRAEMQAAAGAPQGKEVKDIDEMRAHLEKTVTIGVGVKPWEAPDDHPGVITDADDVREIVREILASLVPSGRRVRTMFRDQISFVAQDNTVVSISYLIPVRVNDPKGDPTAPPPGGCLMRTSLLDSDCNMSDNLKSLLIPIDKAVKAREAYDKGEVGSRSDIEAMDKDRRALTGIGLSDTDMPLMRDFAELESLDLSRSPDLTDKGIGALAGISSLRTLKLSSANNQGLTGAGLDRIAGLTELSLATCLHISAEGMAAVGKLKNLRVLDLSRVRSLMDAGMKPLVNLNRLETLSLTGCNSIGDEALITVASLPALTSLHINYAGNAEKGDTSAFSPDAFKALTRSGRLTVLNASAVRVTDECIEALASGAGAAKLRSLDISLSNITDRGLDHVARLTGLESLRIDFARNVTDSGFAHVAKLGKLRELSANNLPGLKDGFVAHLAKLGELRVLDISSCDGVTDAGLDAVTRMTNLEKLNIYGCKNVSAVKVADLRAALPKCEIKAPFGD